MIKPGQLQRNFISVKHFSLFLWIILPIIGIILASQDLLWADQNLYSARGKRDPFTQLISKTSRQASGLIGVETAEELSVEGIVYDSAKGSIVIANGSVLREGEELGNVKVVKIKNDGVLFSVNGIESFKPIYQEDSKEKKS